MELLTIDQWQNLVTAHLQAAKKPLIVVLGPTASGKTDFSLRVADHIKSIHSHAHSVIPERLPAGRQVDEGQSEAPPPWQDAEIINADSRQLYKHLTIGTAKITEEEKRGVVHHLFDVLDPKEEVSIAHYKEMAIKVIEDCHRRNVVPILVGGSMLYISAVVDGLEPLPPSDPNVRKRLEEEWDKDDGWSLYDKLVSVDPSTAKQFEHQNKRYVVRAMELYEKFGVPPSTIKKTIPPPYDILQLGLHWPREELVKRIDERTKNLLNGGWIEEVEGLLDKGYKIQDPGMKSHGYREIMQWLSSEDRNKEELEKVIGAKTRQYAKRQMTWWGNDERIKWIDAQR